MSCCKDDCNERAVDYVTKTLNDKNYIILLCHKHLNEFMGNTYRNSIEAQKNRKRRKPKWWYQSRLDRVGYPIIDHTYTIKENDGSLKVVSNPYHFNMNQLWKVMLICKVFDIHMYISTDSDYSNNTFSIIFTNKGFSEISGNINIDRFFKKLNWKI